MSMMQYIMEIMVIEMIDDKVILAVIPARGGSKGVPRKNIKKLNGKPLISYTIEEALKSKYIDRVVVTTEDMEIAEISRKYGAEVPFIRPAELAEDDTPGIDPIIHCIKWLRDNEGYSPDYVGLFQCTSPLRTYEQIDQAIRDLYAAKGDSIVSVCESEVSPYWMKKIQSGKLRNFLSPDDEYYRRQDLPVIYRLNGAIYIAKTDRLMEFGNWYTDDTLPFIMDRYTSIDIDDDFDFKLVEFLMKEGNEDGV